MTTKNAARAVADVSQGTILARVEIAAPPERVFKALASDEIAKWWGSPQLYRVTKWVGDVRKGGRYTSTGEGADGAFSVEGEFLEVDPPRKLVHTWKASYEPNAATTTVTYRLEPIDGGTRVTVRHEGFTDAASCAQHGEGWELVLGWLNAFIGKKLYFLCRLVPPRPTFMQDMTEAELALMKDHGAYWAKNHAENTAILWGPVVDPKGGWGVGILCVDSEEQASQLEVNDPVMRANKGFTYERLPMARALY
jgi:uncharacterized protein YndB with AHSA1/START domain